MTTDKNKGWFQKYANKELESDGYEPFCLGLIPIWLRSREKYYSDAVIETKKLIEYYWKSSKHLYPSLDVFEKTEFIQKTWERKAPLWWGLNDIIGWIDVRLCVREREIQVSLFLPVKRISKKLKDKQYFCSSRKTISIPARATNPELRCILSKCVEEISSEKIINKRYLDLKHWQRLISYLDIINVIKDTDEEDAHLMASKTLPG